MDFFDEYLRTVLPLMGVPSSAFDYADPLSVLGAFVFSSEILVFILSSFIWVAVKFVSIGIAPKPENSQSGRLDDLGLSTHSYGDKAEVNSAWGDQKKTGFVSAMFKGFVIPVLLIFAGILIVREVAYG